MISPVSYGESKRDTCPPVWVYAGVTRLIANIPGAISTAENSATTPWSETCNSEPRRFIGVSETKSGYTTRTRVSMRVSIDS